MSATRHDIRIRDGGGKGFALVLSGLRYGCERPLLAAAVGLLAARGHTLMTVDFAYAADPRFAQMDDAAQFAAIEGRQPPMTFFHRPREQHVSVQA